MARGLRREIGISAGIMIASVLAASAGMYWLRGNLTQDADAVAGLRVALMNRTRALESLAALKRDAPVAAAYERALAALVPTEEDLLDAPRRFEAMAQSYGVTAVFKFQGDLARPSETALGRAVFSLDAEGAYADLAQFLEAIESVESGMLLGLDAFDITRSGTRHRLTTRGTLFFKE